MSGFVKLNRDQQRKPECPSRPHRIKNTEQLVNHDGNYMAGLQGVSASLMSLLFLWKISWEGMQYREGLLLSHYHQGPMLPRTLPNQHQLGIFLPETYLQFLHRVSLK
jgi:hypothetical protein